MKCSFLLPQCRCHLFIAEKHSAVSSSRMSTWALLQSANECQAALRRQKLGRFVEKVDAGFVTIFMGEESAMRAEQKKGCELL